MDCRRVGGKLQNFKNHFGHFGIKIFFVVNPPPAKCQSTKYIGQVIGRQKRKVIWGDRKTILTAFAVNVFLFSISASTSVGV